MIDFFRDQKETIQQHLSLYLSQKAEELSPINSWGRDVCSRLNDFACKGKMIRGGLVLLSHSMGRKPAPYASAVQTAAAVELFQSSFLIHDDIMDQDTVRRGFPSIYRQYQKLGEKERFPRFARFGESMGVCAGDLAFFLAFDILNSLSVSETKRKKILDLCIKEITSTCIAQMQDVYWGHTDWGRTDRKVKAEEVYSLYLHKTGRYTFSLPLMAGAIRAGLSEPVIQTLERIGEHLGILFQLKDDELGLFGTEKEIGKPVGSDIKEGKKTLFIALLHERATGRHIDRINKILRKRRLSSPDLDYIRRLVEKLGIRMEAHRKASELAEKAEEEMQRLKNIREESLQVLLELIKYNLERTS